MHARNVIWAAALMVAAVTAVSPTSAKFSTDEIIVEEGETVDTAISAGGNVIVRGTVEEDAVSFGGNVVVERGGRVGKNAVSFGGNIEVQTGGRVGKDAVTIGGTIRVRPGGAIRGERISGVPIRIGRLGNQFKNLFVVAPFAGVFGLFGSIFGLILFFFKLIFSLLIAVLITFMYPQGVDRMAAAGQREPGKTLLMGLVTGMILVVLLPMTLLLLVITLIGIPLVPFVIFLLVIAYLVGMTGLSLWIGLALPNGAMRGRMTNVILGVMVIALLKLFPVIGFLVGVAGFFAALGLIMISRFGTQRQDIAAEPGAV